MPSLGALGLRSLLFVSHSWFAFRFELRRFCSRMFRSVWNCKLEKNLHHSRSTFCDRVEPKHVLRYHQECRRWSTMSLVVWWMSSCRSARSYRSATYDGRRELEHIGNLLWSWFILTVKIRIAWSWTASERTSWTSRVFPQRKAHLLCVRTHSLPWMKTINWKLSSLVGDCYI